MSRIDEALRRAEGVLPDGSAPATVGHAPSGMGLADYPSEAPARERVTPLSGNGARAPHTPEPSPPPAPVAAIAAGPVPGTETLDEDHLPERARDRAWEQKLVTDPAATLIAIEQYRRLAAALHDVQVERGVQTVMITSTVPGEGKTLTVANLGLTLSASYGKRVLLIDADLRDPSLHRLFHVHNTAGLSDLLRGADATGALVTLRPGLTLLPAGKPGATPLAGLTSEHMASVLEDSRNRFDWVLIDTPPVGLLPDAQLLARLTRSVVFVIGAGATPSALVDRAVAELGPDCVIGTVLNQVEDHTVPEVNYYNRYPYGGRYARRTAGDDDEAPPNE